MPKRVDVLNVVLKFTKVNMNGTGLTLTDVVPMTILNRDIVLSVSNLTTFVSALALLS